MNARVAKRPMTNPRISMDLKYVDTDITTQTAGTIAGAIVPLTGIDQDVTQNGRTGGQVTLKSLQCRWILSARDGANGGASAGSFAGYRIIFFQWHPATTPVAADVVEGVPVNGSRGDSNINSNINSSSRGNDGDGRIGSNNNSTPKDITIYRRRQKSRQRSESTTLCSSQCEQRRQ